VLRETVNVPPTIRVAQGARLQVLVARDVSFADVYTVADR
jgi:type IV secretory pathway VirB10-like protein